MTDSPSVAHHAERKFFLFDGKGGATLLTAEQATRWQPEDGFLWIKMDYTDDTDQAWLKARFGEESVITEALLAEEPRPRITPLPDGLLIALRAVNLIPGATPDDMVAVRLYIDRHQVITTRRRPILSIADVEELLLSGRGPDNAGEFLLELIDRIVWRMSDTVDQLEDLVADFEDRTLDNPDAGMRFDLANVRRQAISLRRYLAPQREALAHLMMEKAPWLSDHVRLQLREVADRQIRHIEDLDEVRERAALTQEEMQGRLAEQLNARMYLLSIVAAIFMPLSFLTGLLGINVGGIPGATEPKAFFVFLGILAVIMTGQFLWFRWKKWL